MNNAISRAAELLSQASAVLITAGAGMSVDSGLPDFRGPEGFWRAYPKLAHTGLRFEEMANPTSFLRDPRLAWAFYGHRLECYRNTDPHPGYSRLLRLTGTKRGGGFVVTSNVDGAFQKAGFQDAQIYEIHGSIHQLQCCSPCSDAIWSAAAVTVAIDQDAFRADGLLPTCPTCGKLARPNILMFSDGSWIADRSEAQRRRFQQWLAGVDSVGDQMVVVEIGAGTSLPSIRRLSERIAGHFGAPLIRINPRESQCGLTKSVSLPMAGLEALTQLI